MPRTKAFDVEDVLDKAKDQFWAGGFEATSMDDLLKAMGINRGSFYDTFGNKHDLLLDALRRYIEHDRKAKFEALSQTLPPREVIQTIFESRLQCMDDPKGRTGCFLVNTALELSSRDQAIAEVVQEAFEDLAKFFSKMVKQGQQAQQINAALNPTQAGRLLLNHLLGLLVLVRSGASTAMLKSIVTQVNQLLD